MKPSREDFCHPYQPYDIQIEFMQSLYQSIEDGKVAIFESPTGTGKSLSLICGSLTWLRDNSRRLIEGSFEDQGGGDDEDWLIAAEKSARKRDFLFELAEAEQNLVAVQRRELAREEAKHQARELKKTRLTTSNTRAVDVNDDDFMLDDYYSGDEKLNQANGYQSLSASTLALLEKLKPAVKDDSVPEKDRVKIIFCSRTHSQLTQFINELRRVTPPPGIPQSDLNSSLNYDEVVKHLPLGSRKNLCINEMVSRLPSTTAINERCIELQKPGVAKERKCKYLPGRDDKSRVDAFRDRAIATIRDIEDLGKLGQRMELCPYYASRAAIPGSEILTLPYPLLLQRSAREALGVQIAGNVVVIDEAHNLMDAIADAIATSLTLNQIELATKQVITYVQRFKNKLKGSNRMYVTQLIRVLNSFADCMRQKGSLSGQDECVVTAADLMSGKGTDQIRPHKLLQYLVQSKLVHKVEGYLDAHEETTSSPRPKGILLHIQSFLAILMNPDAEGRFFVSKQDSDVIVRYTLLDPREHFRDIVEQARAVILAGGTMSPMSDYQNYLFSYLDVDRLSTFSFGHVIPRENMLAEAITAGPTGVNFDFTFQKRNSEVMMLELGRMLIRVCDIVPDGVVVFFPSYDYLKLVTTVWKQESTTRSVMQLLSTKKKVFEEVRGISSEALLGEYSQTIDKGNGGIMLSVVGGKLSEGINFSDRLGRAVVAVGLPFPNVHSAEWKAKINHVEQTRYRCCKETEGLSEAQSRTQATAAGKDFYENACMRAVNQSIGRAIRHKSDYASILLVDRRFATDRIQKKLPQWIRASMRGDGTSSWTRTEANISQFFSDKQ